MKKVSFLLFFVLVPLPVVLVAAEKTAAQEQVNQERENECCACWHPYYKADDVQTYCADVNQRDKHLQIRFDCEQEKNSVHHHMCLDCCLAARGQEAANGNTCPICRNTIYINNEIRKNFWGTNVICTIDNLSQQTKNQLMQLLSKFPRSKFLTPSQQWEHGIKMNSLEFFGAYLMGLLLSAELRKTDTDASKRALRQRRFTYIPAALSLHGLLGVAHPERFGSWKTGLMWILGIGLGAATPSVFTQKSKDKEKKEKESDKSNQNKKKGELPRP